MNEYEKLLKQIHLTYSNELYVVDYLGHLIKLECPFIANSSDIDHPIPIQSEHPIPIQNDHVIPVEIDHLKFY